MKRKIADSSDEEDLEIDFLNKIPKLDGDERETDAIDYHFNFTLRHIASVKLLFSKCLEFFREEVSKTYFRNCVGETYFADILLKYLYSVLPDPECTTIRTKLSNMVTQVVKTIYEWIRHIDRSLFNVRCMRQSIALDFIHHIDVTDRGTIDYSKSASNMLTDPKFDDFDRLKIIAVHCLERFVYPVMKRVEIPTNGKKIYSGTMQMIEFWKGCIERNELMRDLFYKIDEQVYSAVGTTNNEALKFLWSKTNEEGRNKMLIKLMRRSTADFQCHLLNELDGDEQQAVFHQCGGVVLNNLYEDYIWGSYVLTTAFHARNVIPSRQYYEFLKRVTFCLQFDNRYRRNEIIFRQMWRYSTKRIKDLIFRHENSNIFYWFRNDINAEYILTLFSDASDGFKQNFIVSSSCMKACIDMIAKNTLNVLETVIKKTYELEEEKNEFKTMLLKNDRCLDTICEFINTGDKAKFDSTVKWFFRDESEANKFKMKFSSSSNYLNVFGNLLDRAVLKGETARDEIDAKELDDRICWLLMTPAEILEFKENVLANSKSFRNVVHRLITMEQYGLIEQLLCWSISDSDKTVAFKESLYGKDTRMENIEVAYNLLWKNDDFKSLDNFITWCFASNDAKVMEFKESVLSSYKEAKLLWGSLLYREELHFADAFIKWCGKKSKEELQKYKNELMLNLDMEYVTNDVRDLLDIRDGDRFGDDETDRLLKSHKLVRWFNPTFETYVKFKALVYADEIKYNKCYNLIRIFLEESDIDGIVS